MASETFDAPLGGRVAIDVCAPCQLFWFDARETLQLTPAATLRLFRLIAEQSSRAHAGLSSVLKCPRCASQLLQTHDLQRNTRFQYFRCPHGHGRLTPFVDFLREKDFIRPLTQDQIAELAANIQSVNCSNCGAPIDLVRGSTCGHCGSPVSMLDFKQAERLISQLQQADRRDKPVNEVLLQLELARARRQVDEAFAAISGSSSDGWHAIARWFTA